MSTKNLNINEIIFRMYRAAGVDNDVKLSKLLNYKSTGTISQWRSTGRIPDKIISKISEMFDVPFDEIKYGKKYAQTQSAHGIGKVREVNDEQARLLLLWDTLEDGQKKTVLAVIEVMAKESRAKDGGGSSSTEKRSA